VLQSDGPLLHLNKVSKIFDGRIRAVDEVTLDVAKGEIVALLGESGCGKSTTLSLINRLIETTSGRIELDGQDIQGVDLIELRRSIGYAFQGIGLFPHMTVEENVGIAPKLSHWESREMKARVDELLSLVHLDPETYKSRMPSQLSGGQQQRVGFARALATSPQLLLLDEPFSALDPITRTNLQMELLEIRKQLELAIVIVTHDVTEAFLLADRIYILKEGRILQSGTPRNLVSDPKSIYVKNLIEMPQKQVQKLRAVLD
tara:strand:- start:1845 stop:2624 length:780 start_codon:yes stop_codon:yes gene_type:complete